MTEIKMPRDDASRLINPKPAADRSVHPVAPYPRTEPVQPHEETRPTSPPAPRQRRQRRKGERRKRNEPVLLDTRSGQDRRGAGRRDDDVSDEEQTQDKDPGIDVYV
jgi:hypothetical protein